MTWRHTKPPSSEIQTTRIALTEPTDGNSEVRQESKMNLAARRFSFQEKCTISHLEIDGEDSGLFTLEPKVREVLGQPVSAWKFPGHTAIPAGTYEVVVNFSNHFQIELPELLSVPGFEGVRIHPGNSDLDTEACLLTGTTWEGGDFIGHSKEAFEELLSKIKAEIASGKKVYITVG